MKIIFLDIDGVLNNWRTNNDLQIDNKNVENLNDIIKDTDAKIVISSTWRKSHSIEELIKLFKQVNCIGEIIGVTPTLRFDGAVRGNEIYDWIEKNKELIGCSRYDFNEYVILDDDSDMLYWQRNNFININGEVGLTRKDVYKAVWMLNSYVNTKDKVLLGDNK